MSTSQKGKDQQVKLDFDGTKVTLQMQIPNLFEKYKAEYCFQTLPYQFRIIFQNITEFYSFLSQSTQNLTVRNQTLNIPISIAGKQKDFHLSLTRIELTQEQKLRKQIMQISIETQYKQKELLSLKSLLEDKNKEFQEKQKIIITLNNIIEQKESQNLKLANKVRHLENHIDDLLNQRAKTQPPLQQSHLAQQFPPIKTKKSKEKNEYGHKITFRLDPTAKNYNKFRTTGNEIQKLHGPTYQLFHNEPLPREGRYYFDIKIVSIKNNNIVVGVITDKNKDEQFSFKKMNCVCYNGYDGSICEQDKQKYVNFKPKDNNRLRTIVDMSQAQVEWIIMGGEAKKFSIGQVAIPPSMIKQQLYPYFELYWEGNRVKLNT